MKLVRWLILMMLWLPAVAMARTTVDLDSGWRFIKADVAGAEAVGFDDGKWGKVSLPHSFNALDGAVKDYYRGPAWYRRSVTLTPVAGQRSYIEFDGAALTTELWVNGVKAGRHEGGYARFRFDITDLVKAGRNLFAVRVDNARQTGVAPLNGDFTVYGGLYRDVRLVTTDGLHVDMLDYGGPGAYVATQVAGDAKVQWTVRVRNDRDTPATAAVSARLSGLAPVTAERIVAPHSTEIVVLDSVVAQPHLWQGTADPYLYAGKVEVAEGGRVTDRIDVPVGLRDVRIDADKGVLLNGRPYDVHGVNLHLAMRPGKGPAISQAEVEADFANVSELGATGLRFAHYQHAPLEYDLADRAGFLIWTEAPTVSEVDPSDAFLSNAEQQLRELIRQNYNHPSVMVWGLGNEIYKVDETSAHVLERLQAVAHEEDASRPTVYANCCADIAGPQASHTDVIASNVYFGWYSGEFTDLGPWLDDNHRRRPATPEGISEYGAGGSIHHEEDPPLRPKTTARWHPEQYQALYHEAAWRQLRDRPWVWAKFIWVGFDFPSAGRNEGDAAGYNDKGLTTFDRTTRKDAWYWYQANWSARPMVYVTSRRFTVRSQAQATVKVYSNQATARLMLNGVDLGEQAVVDHVATWPVRLALGRNSIEVEAGGVSDRVEWIYQP